MSTRYILDIVIDTKSMQFILNFNAYSICYSIQNRCNSRFSQCIFRYIFDFIVIVYEILDVNICLLIYLDAFSIHIHFFCCDCFDAYKFYIIIYCSFDLQFALLHAFMFWFLTMESGSSLKSIVVRLLVVKKAKVSVYQEISLM